MASATLLLVHGAWHGPQAWQPLIDALPDVRTRTVALPSSGHDAARLGDLHDDAAAIDAILATTEGPVVVLGHSYGGCPVSQAERAGDNVRRVIYLSALMQDVGDALLTVTGGTYPEYWDVREHPAGSLLKDYFTVRNPMEVLYNGVEERLAARTAATLGKQSLASVAQPLTRAMWRTVPSTYIVCESDRAIPVALQQDMAGRAERVRRIAAGHSPFLSHPVELARLVREEMTS